jgi:hypothetical protein
MVISRGLDCGIPNEEPHLSLAAAREAAARKQPHMTDPDDPSKTIRIPLGIDMGQFAWPFQDPKISNPLDECGLGVVFYFKMLKSLAILFVLISAITMPSLIMFLSARTLTATQAKYQVVANSQVLLGRVRSKKSHIHFQRRIY